MFQTTLSTIPADIPYINALPERATRWKERLPAGQRRRIGLAWAGSALNPNDQQRTMRLTQFVPLIKSTAESVRWISLQKGPGAEQAASSGLPIYDWTGELRDFAETAALIENLDLVITIDTAVAHLAGAMGKPVWVMLPFVPDWRWMLNRNDSPWYPTMRLFRQEKWGDWQTALDCVASQLK
jgi:hypothetical protein